MCSAGMRQANKTSLEKSVRYSTYFENKLTHSHYVSVYKSPNIFLDVVER